VLAGLGARHVALMPCCKAPWKKARDGRVDVDDDDSSDLTSRRKPNNTSAKGIPGTPCIHLTHPYIIHSYITSLKPSAYPRTRALPRTSLPEQMAEEPPTSVRRVDAPPRASLADVADLVLFCGYVEEGKYLPFLSSSLYNDVEVFIAMRAVRYGPLERTRLHYLVAKGNAARLRSFVESPHGGLDVDVRDGAGWTPLHRTCRVADPAAALAVASILLDAGADPLVEIQDEYRRNALHMASRREKTDLVRLLLDRGVDVNIASSESGATPLHNACGTRLADYYPGQQTNIEATIRLLLERGADPTLTSEYGYTPLHNAAIPGDDIAVRLLLATGRIDLDARDHEGRTPLHVAAHHGRLDAARLLVDAGAAVNARDASHHTPLGWAMTHGRDALASFLRSRGGHM
jgi:ankyrin repeat protein